MREAPAAQDACPRNLMEAENLLGGASGGMQGGPRRGRSPITGPTLPRAAQASQSPVGEKLRARRAADQNSSLASRAHPHAAQASQSPVRRKPRARRAARSKPIPRLMGAPPCPRRAGPPFSLWGNPLVIFSQIRILLIANSPHSNLTSADRK